MALVRLTFSSKVWIPVRVCQTVAVCLTGEGVADKMASGLPILFATVVNTGRVLKPEEYFGQIDPRDSEAFQYELEIDDTQYTDDEDPVLCSELGDLAYPACIFSALVDAIAALA